MKISYQGRQVEAEEVEFLTRKEDWNEYQLVDGAIIKMKTVVAFIYKIPGEITPEGDQMYQVNSNTVLRVKKV